jgi:hypothetical protein
MLLPPEKTSELLSSSSSTLADLVGHDFFRVLADSRSRHISSEGGAAAQLSCTIDGGE